MSRTIVKPASVVILGVGFWAVTETPASAQFMPGFRPGYFWTNPYTGMNYHYNSMYNSTWGMNWVNPYNGMRMTFGYQTMWSGLPPFGYPAYAYPAYTPGYTYPYVGGAGAYGSSNSFANPFVREQLRAFKNAPVPNQEPGESPAPAEPGVDLKNKPAGLVLTGLNRALVEPADRDILSGKVLNELATTIRGLESRGAKAESPLLPAELVAHVNYKGGPSADVIALLGTGRPVMPAALTAAEFEAVREDLDKALTPVLEPIKAGKRPAVDAVDRLITATKKAKETTAARAKPLPEAEAKELSRFYVTLDSLSRVGKDAGAAGLFPQRWTSVGATVAELVRHMNSFKLAFAPAASGDEDVYYSLHRGLVGYYAALSQAKK